MSKAVIIYGPPGSGKGTLASLLTRNSSFIHFDTGQYLEKVLYDSARQKDKIIQKEKKFFETGSLCTPEWVLKIVSEGVKKIAGAGWSVVFSGSPRTMLETFGDSRHSGLIKLLEKLYGRKNIYIFELNAKPQTSIERNSHREICEICGQPSLFLYTGKTPCCAFCAGPLKKRTVDDPKVIPARLTEYQQHTFPILKKLKEKKYQVFSLNAEPAPYKIFREMANKMRHSK